VAEKTAPATSAAISAPAKPDSPVPETKLSDADRALFAQRGSELLAAGDIASARLFFERAANAGDARSALGMAMSFDPVELAKAGVRGVKGDQAKADYWYQRARLLAGTGTSGIK
jgi:TPR repeat protein